MSIATLPMAEAPTIDYAATAFLIVCASLVLFMTVPGLALFYGRHVPGQIGPQHDDDEFRRLRGRRADLRHLRLLDGLRQRRHRWHHRQPFEKLGLAGTDGLVNPFGYEGYGNIPELIFVGFQLTFAVITVALISGAIADRVKFSTWLVFSGLWVTFGLLPDRAHGVGWWSAVRQ